MSFFKTLLFSVVGFIVPVSLFLFVLAVKNFPEFGLPVGHIFHSDLARKAPAPEVVAPPKVIKVGRGAQFARVASHASLDPYSEGRFLVSYLVRFDHLPRVGKRHSIISKYAGSKHPYPGWAMALRQLATSLRLEVYWRDEEGAGGWYSFDDVGIVAGTWYSVTLVAAPNDFLALYLQEIKHPFGVAEPIVEGGIAKEAFRVTRPVVFVGGHDISEVKLPATGADLYLGAKRRGRDGFRGSVSSVLIARSDSLPTSIDQLTGALDGGPSYIVDGLDQNALALWLNGEGSDSSQFAHEIQYSQARLVDAVPSGVTRQ